MVVRTMIQLSHVAEVLRGVALAMLFTSSFAVCETLLQVKPVSTVMAKANAQV